MNTLQIERICSTDPELAMKFKGVYACDQLPAEAESDSFYICNTAPSSHQGLHWIVVYKSVHNITEYFDSLGLSDIQDNIKHFLGYNYRIANVQTQETLSSLCGQYCILYMSLRCRGIPMEDIIELLDSTAYGSDYISYVYDV